MWCDFWFHRELIEHLCVFKGKLILVGSESIANMCVFIYIYIYGSRLDVCNLLYMKGIYIYRMLAIKNKKLTT